MSWVHGSIPILPLLIALVSPILYASEDPKDTAAIRQLLADAAGIGPPAGTPAPPFQLRDQRGREQNLQSLAGPKGLVLVFFRSADW